MKRQQGDIWDRLESDWIVIPTNTTLDGRKRLVMGAGMAKQAKERYPHLPSWAGNQLSQLTDKEKLLVERTSRLILFPTKRDWWKPAQLSLIIKLLPELSRLPKELNLTRVLVPLLGCGLGGLEPDIVISYMERYLDESFVLVRPYTGVERTQRI